MNELLIDYRGQGCDAQGYPWPWAHETEAVDQSNRHPGDGPRLNEPIKDYIRELAGHRCQRCGHPYTKGEHPLNDAGESWSPCDDQCRHPRGILDSRWRYEYALRGDPWEPGSPTLLALEEGRTVIESLWRVLTVHHLDEDKMNCRWWNLAALCQRCHLRMQRGVVMGRPYHFEHSEWFKPFAAGFYGWRYLNEDLSREEVMARMDELLALEHRFTQEVLF